MNKTITNTILMLFTSCFMVSIATAGQTQKITITRASDNLRMEVVVDDGRVVGGVSIGHDTYDVVGGYYDDGHLSFTHKHRSRSGCKGFDTHYIRIQGSRVIRNTVLRGCGTFRDDNGGFNKARVSIR